MESKLKLQPAENDKMTKELGKQNGRETPRAEEKSFNQRPDQKLYSGGLVGNPDQGELSVQKEAIFICFYC